MYGYVAGFVTRAQKKSWGSVLEAGLAIGVLYAIVGVVAILFGWSTILASLGTFAVIYGLLEGLDMIILLPLGAVFCLVGGILDTFLGGIVFEFVKAIQKVLHL